MRSRSREIVRTPEVATGDDGPLRPSQTPSKEVVCQRIEIEVGRARDGENVTVLLPGCAEGSVGNGAERERRAGRRRDRDMALRGDIECIIDFAACIDGALQQQ